MAGVGPSEPTKTRDWIPLRKRGGGVGVLMEVPAMVLNGAVGSGANWRRGPGDRPEPREAGGGHGRSTYAGGPWRLGAAGAGDVPPEHVLVRGPARSVGGAPHDLMGAARGAGADGRDGGQGRVETRAVVVGGDQQPVPDRPLAEDRALGGTAGDAVAWGAGGDGGAELGFARA